MCGICGYISRDKYNIETLERMNNTMYHRGPDDAGVYQTNLSDGKQLGLAQRRLSILDLSRAGHQPMFSENQRYIIVYNGEVYNFLELREALMAKGRRFVSNCDTEVILQLYEEYGIECLEMLNGMFAIAIYDVQSESLVLARDRMGKKPLYYYNTNGSFAFASELKPLLEYPGFHKEIRTELISSYLVNKSIESPNTIFSDTYKVEPGQYIVLKDGVIEKGWYWNLIERFASCSAELVCDYEDAKSGLKELLFDSVRKRLISDVPVGTFLSGGIDSSLVTAIAQKVSDERINTFTIGFYDEKENEATYAKEVADYLGTNHTELYISEKELFEQVKDLVKYYDEPFCDSSQIPTMLVSKLAKEKATVILSGDGGDELFCGYEEYDWIKLAQRFDILGGLTYGLLNLSGIRNLKLTDKMPDKMYGLVNNRDANTKLQLFNDVRERYTREMIVGDSRSSKYDFEREIHKITDISHNWQMQRMLFDMRYYMPDEILVKTDRASMKNSLEVRCPILDYRIVEYSFRLPHAMKYHHGNKKHILKDIAYEMVPRELLDRPKKGFGVPLAKWMRGELHSQLLRYANPNILKKQDIFVPEKIQEFIRKLMVSDTSLYNSVLWGFFVFQMWYQEYIEDLW